MDNENGEVINERPVGEEPPPRVEITIKCQDGREVKYSVRRDIQFQRLFLAFCERVNLDYRTVNFLYDGARIPVRQTPNDLEMEDEDEIDVMFSVGGGGSR